MSNKKKFLVNSGWMIGQQIYSMVLSLLVGVLTSRYLGPSNVGLINYGSSLISFFYVLSQLGIDDIIVNEMIKRPEKQGDYLGTALVMRLVVSLLSIPTLMFIICYLEPNNPLLHIVTFLQAISIVLNSYEVLVFWFQMKLKMQVVSLATIVALTIVSVWKSFLLINKEGIELFAFSVSIQALVSGAFVIAIFVKKSKVKLRFCIDDAKYLYKHSSNYIMGNLAIALYTQLDKVMIGKMMNEEEVGYYSIAVNLASMWMFVVFALINSSRSIIISYKQEKQEMYLKRYKQLLLGITVVSLFFCTAFTGFGWIAVRVLYGKAFMPAVVPLCFLVWSNYFALIGCGRSIWIAAESYYKYPKYFAVFGAVLNVILNYFFISNIGMTGAALATLFTQLCTTLAVPLLFKETRPFVKIYIESFSCFPELFAKGKVMIVEKIKRFKKK